MDDTLIPEQISLTSQLHSVAYVAVFLNIAKPTLYRWMHQGDLPFEDFGGLSDRYIRIEDAARVKAAKRPGRPKRDKCEKQSV
jgi:excisionase family DNA binding protein